MNKETVCGCKGISVFLHTNDLEIEAAILRSLNKNRSFKPSLPPFYCKLRFKQGAGKVWQNGKHQPFHCNFFKEDDFSISLVDIIEVKRCNNV
ncbi:MAG: hypothetical protein V1897_12520 [Pseudomonadota bacterium]